MKLISLTILLAFVFPDSNSQTLKVSFVNDTTELQEYENGEKLKVIYRANGRTLTLKEKDSLLLSYPFLPREFNIKSDGPEITGEINFTEPGIQFPVVKAAVVENKQPLTLNLSGNLTGLAFPAFTWKDLGNQAYSLDALKGKVVVLNFWHTSCVPCIAEMPLLNQLKKEFENDPVVFLAVSPNTIRELSEFLGKRKFDYHQIPGVDTKDFFSPFPGWPIHVVLDREGFIRFSVLGKQKDIEKKLAKAISQSIH